jgi:hypothetical protein
LEITARNLLNILLNVLSETQRKNWNCLSPAQQDGFSNFSGVSLARSKMGKPASAGITNRKYQHRIATPATPPQADGASIRHNKKFPENHLVQVWQNYLKSVSYVFALQEKETWRVRS